MKLLLFAHLLLHKYDETVPSVPYVCYKSCWRSRRGEGEEFVGAVQRTVAETLGPPEKAQAAKAVKVAKQNVSFEERKLFCQSHLEVEEKVPARDPKQCGGESVL